MNCKNCDIALKNSQNYCDECGAKVIRKRLTFRNLFEHISETFFNYDNKLLRTFIELFTSPENVIVGYIEGVRKKYVNVISYFGISLTLAGIQFFLITTFFSDALELNFGFPEALENSAAQKNNPFLSSDADEMGNIQSISYIVAVPFSAFATWVVYSIFGDKRYNFTEHLVINLYYSAQIIIVTSISSILFLIFGFNYFLVSVFITIPMFIYLGYVLKRIFGNNFWETTAILLLTIIIYLVFYFIVGLIIAGIMIALNMLQ